MIVHVLQWIGWCTAACTLFVGALFLSESRHGRRFTEGVADRIDPPAYTTRVLRLVRSCSWCGSCEDLAPELGPVDSWRNGAAMHASCADQHDRRRKHHTP